MFEENKICHLLNIKYPIIQGGMVWVSGAKLAAAVSNAGGLGVIGAGSMNLELLESQILKATKLTKNPLALNIPLLYKNSEKQVELALKLGIKIFITSAGSPNKHTKNIQDRGAIVGHVSSTPGLAKKCENAGVDFIVAEGFEAGGHNGRDEITSMTLIPQVADSTSIPLVAAGGIVDARSMSAAFMLGADAVQMGSRFVMAKESSAHQNFKEMISKAGPASTMLSMKSTVPVRLLKNKFYNEITNLEFNGSTPQQLLDHLGKGRAQNGMLNGDIENGELEIGQVAAMLNSAPPAKEIINSIIQDFKILNRL